MTNNVAFMWLMTICITMCLSCSSIQSQDKSDMELFIDECELKALQAKDSEVLKTWNRDTSQIIYRGTEKGTVVINSLLKKRYPDKIALMKWAEKELGIK